MTQVVAPARDQVRTESTIDPSARARRGASAVAIAFAAVTVLIAALHPALRAGFWSWDWYWIDQHALGNTAWGGSFYDLGSHANPLPVEVQWYAATLSLLGLHPLAHHVLTLAGLLMTLSVLYLLTRRLGMPRWAGVFAVVLSGLAPASLTSWTWYAASPHMWAALLGLAAALAHVTWRQNGSRTLALAAPVLSVLGLGMKNDAVIGPLLILAWEWSRGRSERLPGRLAVTAAAVLPMAVFVWWQATAVDPHRDTAQTGVWQVLGNTLGLLRFAFLWQTGDELRAEFPPSPPAPSGLLVAGAVVGAVLLALAVVSLRTRVGRILAASALASLGPVAVLDPALVSRYVLPPVLLLTAAAGAGAAHLAQSRVLSRKGRALAVVAAMAALAVWGTLAHLSAGAGAVAVREERALLAGLVQAGLSPADALTIRLADSPLEPTTAHLRQSDPDLPPPQRLRRLAFIGPHQPAPEGIRLATATRLADGSYVVHLEPSAGG